MSDEVTGPVGSVYKKTQPQAEIRRNVTDQFWQQAEVRISIAFHILHSIFHVFTFTSALFTH